MSTLRARSASYAKTRPVLFPFVSNAMWRDERRLKTSRARLIALQTHYHSQAPTIRNERAHHKQVEPAQLFCRFPLEPR
jgi:hypothetical protein